MNPSVLKVLAKNPNPQIQPLMGSSVALNEKWLIVGERGHDQPNNSGAVHVFDPTSGRHLFVLRPPQPAVDSYFGNSVAVHGDLALVGEYFGTGAAAKTGVAHLFDLRTGKLLRTLQAANGSNGDTFGASVALSGSVAAVGAPQKSGAFMHNGAVYLFDPATGAPLGSTEGEAADDFLGWSVAASDQIVLAGAINADGAVMGSGRAYLIHGLTGQIMRILQATDGAMDDGFGASVALHGRRALVGAPMGHNPTTLETGAAYVFDILTGGQSMKLDAPVWSQTDAFGGSLALNDTLAFVAASGNDASRGAVSVFSLLTGQLIQQFTAPDAQSSGAFGASVAVFGNTVAVGAAGDDSLGIDSGATYLMKPFLGLMPFFKQAATGDSAPEAPGARFTGFGDPAVNDLNKSVFTARLSGPSPANAGVWHGLSPAKAITLGLRKGNSDNGRVLRSLGQPILNDPTQAVVEATLSGPQASAGRNRAIYGLNAGSFTRLIQLGDFPISGGGPISKFLQLTQSSTAGSTGLAFQFARSPGLVSAFNDTGLLTLMANGAVASELREGSTSPTGDLYGQFGRQAFPFNRLVFAAGLQGNPFENQGVFSAEPGMMASLIARKGQPAPGMTGHAFRSFVGETAASIGHVLLRATFTSPGASPAGRVGLWSNHTGTLQKVAAAGDAVPGLPGVTWTGFTRYWTGGFGVSSQLMFLGRMKGTGVTSANDHALCLVQEDGSRLLLLREGDRVPDASGACIGSLLNVIFRPDTGRYLVLASLAKAPAASNLALFSGATQTLPMSAGALRRPWLVLRKGMEFKSLLGGTTRLSSLRLGTSGFDPTGAGHKGLASPLSSFGVASLTLTYSDRTTELVRGQP